MNPVFQIDLFKSMEHGRAVETDGRDTWNEMKKYAQVQQFELQHKRGEPIVEVVDEFIFTSKGGRYYTDNAAAYFIMPNGGMVQFGGTVYHFGPSTTKAIFRKNGEFVSGSEYVLELIPVPPDQKNKTEIVIEDEPEEPTNASAPMCIVCCDKPINSIFLPCCHACTCIQCGENWLKNQKPPICMNCRDPVTKLNKMFLS